MPRLPVSAGVVDSLVGVALLRVDSPVVLDVLEGRVHVAAVASRVVVLLVPGAVDQVLLAQRDELSCLAEVLTLQGPSLKWK